MKCVVLFLLSGLAMGLCASTVWAQKADLTADFQELTDSKPVDVKKWEACSQSVNVSWGSADVRYSKTNVPDIKKVSLTWRESAWKGERVNAQAVIWSTVGCKVGLEVTDLVASNGDVIPASAVKANFLRYVMTDELNKDKKGTCGYRPDRTKFDSSIVADIIDIKAFQDMEARTVRPVWVSIQVPGGIKAGVYKGSVKVTCDKAKTTSLLIDLRVVNKELPAPKDWAFRLDLWQNPFSSARYYDLPLWSEEHFEAMRPAMEQLAAAGQRTITASVMYKPWGGQTEDHFESMVMRIKKLDGSWAFDYAVFDKWVEFMMGLGIDKQINCYTMIPWSLSFQYFDQASNSLKELKAEVGTPEYVEYWQPFLSDFARHLKEKGWFDITTIAMDERPMKAMQQAIKIIREADPNYKVALAGNYHGEIEADICDYSIASGQFYPEDVLKERRSKGMVSTYYTCCSEAYPNTFTFSPIAEAVWLGWYAAAKDFDGYLRWAYNSWTKNPLEDSRFRAFGGGDCYLIYPGGRSSIRLDRLVEGIQDFEKVRILKEKYTKEGNGAKLKAIDNILKDFEIEKLATVPAADMVNKARAALNKL